MSACICRLNIRRFCQVANVKPACEIVSELHCQTSLSIVLLAQVQQSTMQIWLGLFTTGAQRTKSKYLPKSTACIKTAGNESATRASFSTCLPLETSAGTPCEGASNLDLRKVSPTPLHLAVQRLDAHNKTITSEVRTPHPSLLEERHVGRAPCLTQL